MAGIRDLKDLLVDLDRRQRPDARSRNRIISKYTTVADTVGLSSDTLILNAITPPFLWAPATAGSTANEGAWGMFEWQ